MIQKFVSTGLSFAAILVLVLASNLPGASSAEAAEQAICAVTAGTNGGQKYATLKCAKKTSPNNYVIRSTVWERKDKKGYRELAAAAGHRFNCTLTKQRTSTGSRIQTTYYKINSCK